MTTKNTKQNPQISYFDACPNTDFLSENIFVYELKNISRSNIRVHSSKIINTNPNVKFESIQYIKDKQVLLFFTDKPINDRKYNNWIETKNDIIYECGLKNTMICDIESILSNPCSDKAINLYVFYNTIAFQHRQIKNKIERIKDKITFYIQTTTVGLVKTVKPKIIDDNTLILNIENISMGGVKQIEIEIKRTSKKSFCLNKIIKNSTSIIHVESIYTKIEPELRDLFNLLIKLETLMKTIPKEMILGKNLYVSTSYDEENFTLNLYCNKLYPDIKIKASDGIIDVINFDSVALKILRNRELQLFSAIEVPTKYLKNIKNIKFKKPKKHLFK